MGVILEMRVLPERLTAVALSAVLVTVKEFPLSAVILPESVSGITLCEPLLALAVAVTQAGETVADAAALAVLPQAVKVRARASAITAPPCRKIIVRCVCVIWMQTPVRKKCKQRMKGSFE